MTSYSNLTKAVVGRDYLNTNSTTHEFLFGALAELVDNSRDANSKSLSIYTENHYDQSGQPFVIGGFSLNFLDDGDGMNPEEVRSCINFGKSYKKNLDLNLIGQYGNGLKSSSMRIGNDMVFFTKKNGIQTCLLLSRTFLESELEESDGILLPIPSFYAGGMKPCLNERNETNATLELHTMEVNLIMKYSPFKTPTQLLEQFNKIQDHGTLVICFNLKLLASGNPEFDIETDPYDIKMAECKVEYEDRKSQEEHNSFRSYVSILYHNPKMKIYLQHKKVLTKILDKALYYPLRYKYVSKKFKAYDEQERRIAEDKLKRAKDLRRDKTTQYNDYKNRYNKKSEQECRILVQKKRELENSESEIKTCEHKLAIISKRFNEPKSLDFVFGINVQNRAADGLFVYNCNRLILMYEHTKQQKRSTNFRGIVGVVNVPKMVLEPTHNKQHFVDKREEQSLMTELGNYMEQYLRHLTDKERKPLNLEFWRPFGYFDMNFNFLPSDEDQYKRKRIMNTTLLLQCNNVKCLKWRVVDWNRRNLAPNFPPDSWECKDNLEVGRNSCKFPEHLEEIELKEIRRTNEEIIKTTPVQNGVTLTHLRNDVVLKESTPSARVNDYNAGLISRKRGLTRDQNLTDNSESDLSQNESRSTRAEHQKDPNWSRANSNGRTAKKTRRTATFDVDSMNEDSAGSPVSERYIQSNFERVRIETENIESDAVAYKLRTVKEEPVDDSMLVNAQSIPSGHTFESSIEIRRRNSQSSYSEALSESIINKFKFVLEYHAHDSNDPQLVQNTKSLSVEDLANFNVDLFLKNYKEKLIKKYKKESISKETSIKRSYKERVRAILDRNPTVSEKEKREIDKIFTEYSSDA